MEEKINFFLKNPLQNESFDNIMARIKNSENTKL